MVWFAIYADVTFDLACIVYRCICVNDLSVLCASRCRGCGNCKRRFRVRHEKRPPFECDAIYMYSRIDSVHLMDMLKRKNKTIAVNFLKIELAAHKLYNLSKSRYNSVHFSIFNIERPTMSAVHEILSVLYRPCLSDGIQYNYCNIQYGSDYITPFEISVFKGWMSKPDTVHPNILGYSRRIILFMSKCFYGNRACSCGFEYYRAREN